MEARGSYAKGIAKRDEILRTALDVIARNGYRKTSIRELAAAVGLSQTGLLHYFGSKEQLYVEVLRKRDEVDALTYGGVDDGRQEPDTDVIGALSGVVRHNAEVPGLVQLYVQLSAEATEAGHPAHEYFRDRSSEFRRVVAGAIQLRQDAGELPDSLDSDRIAMLLMVAIDGLQSQWLLDDSIDMVSYASYLWESLTRE